MVCTGCRLLADIVANENTGRSGGIADSEIEPLMTAPPRGAIESADRYLHNCFEQFTWLCAVRANAADPQPAGQSSRQLAKRQCASSG